MHGSRILGMPRESVNREMTIPVALGPVPPPPARDARVALEAETPAALEPEPHPDARSRHHRATEAPRRQIAEPQGSGRQVGAIVGARQAEGDSEVAGASRHPLPGLHAPARAHEIHAPGRCQRAHQDGGRLALGLGDQVQAQVDTIDEIDVGL